MTLEAAYKERSYVSANASAYTRALARIQMHTHANPVSRKTGQIPLAAVGGFDAREEKENDSRSGLCPLVQWYWFFLCFFFTATDVVVYSFVLDQRMKQKGETETERERERESAHYKREGGERKRVWE
jgi:hypothetical protein